MPSPRGDQLAGQRYLGTFALAADHRPQQPAGPGLGQRHDPHRGIPGQAQTVPQLPQPGPVPVTIRHMDRIQAIERDRTQPAPGNSPGPR